MATSLSDTERALAMLAEALDADRGQHSGVDRDRRGENRRPLRADCELCLFEGLKPTTAHAHGVVRNASFRGVSIVVRPPKLLQPTEPVEVTMSLPGRSWTHLAGLVAFCRQIDDDACEVGIEVMAAGSAPILYGDIAKAKKLYDWFSKALSNQGPTDW